MTYDAVCLGPVPQGDGWGAIYRSYARMAGLMPPVRRLARSYFMPSALERWRDGAVFQYLGVHLFGRVIPTGGISIRRVTGARMAPYTLSGVSLESARQFFFRTCAFESAHFPFFIFLLVLAVMRYAQGQVDLAAENTLVNLAVNIYPIMHHRRTRYRIVRLLERKQRAIKDTETPSQLAKADRDSL
ncbi:MAG: hypothetical protein HKM89_11920 [Gemmatimonadales bacterium]|nr:hypothetical protein [Gemmatimonadales bacterium]